MYRYSFMLSNSHEVTVEAGSYNEAMEAVSEAYPDEYVIGSKRLPSENPEEPEDSAE